jgi:penicillin-binding protein 2
MKVIREHRTPLVERIRLMGFVLVGLFLLVAAGFWSVQIAHGDYYRSLAESNRLRRIPIRAPRGLIYDRHGRLLVENIPSYNLMIDRSRAADLDRSLAFSAEVLGVPVEELGRRLEAHRGVPDFKPVPLAERLSLGQVARLGVSSLEMPEFEIDVEHRRYYRHGPQTGHVLGYLGEVSEERLKAYPDLYAPGDLVGLRGIEERFDRELRGRDGRVVVVVDSRGKVIEEFGRESARPGQNLTLTLDLGLQQEAEKQMRDRVGAVVALDPDSGEILALYSAPAYDPNMFARGLSRQEWLDLLAAEHNPLQNRAIQNHHSPGSLFKIVMGVAGLTEGLIDEQDRVFCGGSATIYGRRFGCWKAGGHGWVDLQQAIKGSCNVYFYQLGQRLGVDRIAHYGRLFGLGQRTGLGLAGEKPGLVPDSRWSLEARGHAWFPGETISLSIGQGPLLVTPLQMARLVAATANGGRLIQPTLVKGPGDRAAQTLEVPPETLRPIREGLAAVINEAGGTAYGSARLPDVAIAGKSGTAQVVGVSSAKDTPFERRTHAWFAAYGPVEDPRLVVVVFVEHGGGGSAAAAPIVRALFETYLGSRSEEPAGVKLARSG